MNETASVIIWTSVCWVIAFMVFFIAKYFGKRGTESDYQRAERDCERAADYNRELSEQERATREAIEEARRAGKRTEELLSDTERNNNEAGKLIREQAEDNRRAGENNKRARELIKKAEDILSSDSD